MRHLMISGPCQQCEFPPKLWQYIVDSEAGPVKLCHDCATRVLGRSPHDGIAGNLVLSSPNVPQARLF